MDILTILTILKYKDDQDSAKRYEYKMAPLQSTAMLQSQKARGNLKTGQDRF